MLYKLVYTTIGGNMLYNRANKETLTKRILAHARDYGVANPNGATFDREFNVDETNLEIEKSQYSVGQSRKALMYPNGMTPDGQYTSPTVGINPHNVDPDKARDITAENLVQHYWRKNRERIIKYRRMSQRAEISEAISSICDEAVYHNEVGESVSIMFHPDAPIGDKVKEKLAKLFRMDVARKLFDFKRNGWRIMRNLLIEGRVFFEVIYNNDKNEIIGLEPLPAENMIVVIQEGVIIGYRQMLDGQYTKANVAQKNYIDFSPNQILYTDLGSDYHGPGGINDPFSILEEATKDFNRLNAVEDAVVMYRIQWGSEKLVFKIDTGALNPAKAEKHMADQSKVLSRRVDYNTSTGEIANYGRVIGLGEHYFISTSARTSGSSIERLSSGENISNIDDLKYFKRNLVGAMHVPPGHVTALAGDGDNFSNGKIGEVTQSEVTFARMVHRYQDSLSLLLIRAFMMVLNTRKDIDPDIKKTEYYDVHFNKVNSFQNYIDSEVLSNNLSNFDNMMKYVATDEAPDNPLSLETAFRLGLRLNSQEYSDNKKWLEKEMNSRSNKGGKNSELDDL
jgi:hypothetical protein